MLDRELHRLLAVACHADQLDVIDSVEERRERIPHESVVVGDEDRNLGRLTHRHLRTLT